MTSPRISIILPACNAGRFLRKSLDSVLKQTYPDFELMICDDASTDDTADILAEYAARDMRVKILRNSVRSGVARTLNKLLSAAECPLIARMDADDICEPERLERQVGFLEAHPQVSFLGSQLLIIDESDAVVGRRFYPSGYDDICRSMLIRNSFAHPSMVMRRDSVMMLGGYREIRGAEDYDLWMRALNYGFRMENVDEALLRYRISSGQEKKRNLKPTLRATLSLQRKYLFNRRFFTFKAFFAVALEHLLLCLPDAVIMKLFVSVTYASADEK